MNNKRKVLLISSDRLGRNMAGPAIRYYEMAKVLHKYFEVILAAPYGSTLPQETLQDLRLVEYDSAETDNQVIYQLAENTDITVIQGAMLFDLNRLRAHDKYLIIDLYDPFTLETLQVYRYEEALYRQHLTIRNVKILNEQLILGDFFICGSEKQRDYWLGALAAMNRLNPQTSDDDPTFRRLIDLVSFGLAERPTMHTTPVLKGVHPGIGASDLLLIWGGGIWEWFDAKTLIHAMAQIGQQRQDIKLFFMGITHPNPDVPQMKACYEALELADKLKLTNRLVFFNEWTPYAERQKYLLEADIGISLHLDQIETRFSLRTRIFDYIWAGLPIITTEGDSMSELVAQYNLGRIVKERDTEGLVQAIIGLAEIAQLREYYQPAFRQLQTKMRWEQVMQPLLNYCYNPYHAADYPGLSLDARDVKSLELQSETYLLRHKLQNLQAVYTETVSYAEKLTRDYEETAQYARNLETILDNPVTLVRRLIGQVIDKFPRKLWKS